MEVFMDDFSVYGATCHHRFNNLSKVLQRCEDVNLVLNWEKCYFMIQEGVVLGHVISNKGTEDDKNFSKITKPLTVKDVPFPFNKECLSAFLMLKEALITALVMEALDWELPFEVMCDASDYTVGAILGQRKDNKPYTIYKLYS